MSGRGIIAIVLFAAACSSKPGGSGTGPRLDGGDAGVTPIALHDHGPPPPDARRDPVSTAAPADQFWTQGDAACPDGAKLTGSPSSRQAYCYASDGMHGPSASWDDQGNLIELGLHDRGKREGQWTRFHPDGSKAQVSHWHLGNMHGATSSWYPGGARQDEGSYLDGRPDGTFTSWAPDGKELGSFTMENGNGTFRGWHANGQLSFEQVMAHGQAHGAHTSWHPNGQKASEMTFARDLPVGKSTHWDDQGRKTVEGQYLRGNMDGDWTYYDATGAIERVDTYRDSDQVASVDYQDGAPLADKLPAQGDCATDQGAREAWTEATGKRLDDDGGCFERARHFGGVVIVGGFAHDRGCMTMGYLLDCEHTTDLDPARLLARAGWKKARAENREKLAMYYLREIATRWEGGLTDDPEPARFVREPDGGITVVAWVAEPSGMRCGRTVHQMEYRFSDQGALSVKNLETRDERCD
jgi:antitoxin component YwqK of YwqJK toxin-antitoxin module